jgi:Zn-finger nucleic acid-binding protein
MSHPPIVCPKDGVLMEKVDLVGGVEVDHCAACGAVWLDADELERVLAVDGAAPRIDIGGDGAVPRGFLVGPMVCPRDRRPLITQVDPVQEHVHFEACTACGGMLLDAGELSDLGEVTMRERVRGFIRRMRG